MKFHLFQMSVNNKDVLSFLISYLDRMKKARSFRPDLMLRVFVDSSCDFTAFEVVDHVCGYTSAAHRIHDTIVSRYKPLYVDYTTFERYCRSLLSGASN